jgi:hypothetical protein
LHKNVFGHISGDFFHKRIWSPWVRRQDTVASSRTMAALERDDFEEETRIRSSIGFGLSLGPLLSTGANPTIASYNASAVKIYNTASNLVRFESKNNFF